MDDEQILKQLNWLDEERRKDKMRIAALEERLNAAQGSLTPLLQQVKEIEGEITRLSALVTRMDGLDQAMLQLRLDNKQSFEDMNKAIKKREDETNKLRREELRSLEKSLAEAHQGLEQVTEIKRNLTARADEDKRLAAQIDELRARLETIRRDDEENNRTIRLMDESRRQDAKRLTDLQGELTAIRKRSDENMGRLDLSFASMKKLETRINDLLAVENERRETINNFLNSQALKDVERDRLWKEWQARFQLIESQAAEIDTLLQNMDESQRALRQSQKNIDELASKVERCINEITEIQRLAEERFRQEWVTFKADDQKRWTNYTLTTDEQQSAIQRQQEKLEERITKLEDDTQALQDDFSQLNDLTENRLQNILTILHEWVTAFERLPGQRR